MVRRGYRTLSRMKSDSRVEVESKSYHAPRCKDGVLWMPSSRCYGWGPTEGGPCGEDFVVGPVGEQNLRENRDAGPVGEQNPRENRDAGPVGEQNPRGNSGAGSARGQDPRENRGAGPVGEQNPRGNSGAGPA